MLKMTRSAKTGSSFYGRTRRSSHVRLSAKEGRQKERKTAMKKEHRLAKSL